MTALDKAFIDEAEPKNLKAYSNQQILVSLRSFAVAQDDRRLHCKIQITTDDSSNEEKNQALANASIPAWPICRSTAEGAPLTPTAPMHCPSTVIGIPPSMLMNQPGPTPSV